MSRPTWLKAAVAGLLAASTWGVTALADERVDSVEWFTLLGAVVTAAAVYVVKNGEDDDPTTSTPDVRGGTDDGYPAF